MLHGVAAPCKRPAPIKEAVYGPRACPHKVGTGFVIIGLGDCNGRVFYDRFEQHLHEPIQHIQIIFGIKVNLAYVAYYIRRAARRLVCAYGVSHGGVKEGRLGHKLIVPAAYFIIGFGVAYNAAVVHFGARCSYRQHGYHRQRAFYGRTVFYKFPRVNVRACAGGNELGRVYCAAAANGQYHVYILLLAKLRPAPHGIYPRVGFNARQLRRIKSGSADLSHYLIVKPALFY